MLPCSETSQLILEAQSENILEFMLLVALRTLTPPHVLEPFPALLSLKSKVPLLRINVQKGHRGGKKAHGEEEGGAGVLRNPDLQSQSLGEIPLIVLYTCNNI